jgi:RNA polymerase sigma-70 factor (ECF subfamily)
LPCEFTISPLILGKIVKVSKKIIEAKQRKKQTERKATKTLENLKELVEACIRKERKAQHRFFELYYGKMMSVCLRYIKDRDSAQEVLQDGFIKVFDKLDLFDFRGSIEGWMRRIFSNTAIDAIRKAKRNPFLSENDNDFKDPGVNQMEEKEDLETLQLSYQKAMDSVDQLSPAYRTVFNLYVFEEYSHKEIAEILGISEGTSKSNLAKARMNLQKMLEKKNVYNV